MSAAEQTGSMQQEMSEMKAWLPQMQVGSLLQLRAPTRVLTQFFWGEEGMLLAEWWPGVGVEWMRRGGGHWEGLLTAQSGMDWAVTPVRMARAAAMEVR